MQNIKVTWELTGTGACSETTRTDPFFKLLMYEQTRKAATQAGQKTTRLNGFNHTLGLFLCDDHATCGWPVAKVGTKWWPACYMSHVLSLNTCTMCMNVHAQFILTVSTTFSKWRNSITSFFPRVSFTPASLHLHTFMMSGTH